MSESMQAHSAQPWYREPWPWILMAGPATVVVAGLITAYIAVTHNDALVVDNYYKEGLAINRVLERDEAARQAGYRAQVLFSVDGTRVRVYLSSPSALPQSLRLRMVHPTQAALDREAILGATRSGWYEGEVGIAPAARWRVELEDGARSWRLTGDWRPAEGGAFALEPRQ